MKLKGYTQIGILTALIILFYQVLMIKLSLQNSGLVALQYALLFIGIFISVFVYHRANKLVILDLFMIGFRTLSTTVILLVAGSLFFYFFFPKTEGMGITQVIMPVVFFFGFSGVLSSFVSAVIINKLLSPSET